ncbi:MAG TPA: ABC transporter permease, partial [bacterium]|nr:ABC transporter permease [bacterium]
MSDPRRRLPRASTTLLQLAAIVLAILLTTLVLLAANAPPVAAYLNILLGAVGSWNVAANVVVSWVPLLLATAGLLVTFTAGLWNIGIEGQITLGAVFTTWILRAAQGTSV